jgi:membrane-bound serine protease (ClpP class)
MRRFGAKTSLLFLSVFLLAPLCLSVVASRSQVYAETQAGSVIIANFDVPVDPGSSEFMSRVADTAISQGASAVVIQMNTPGGLLSDMINIVSSVTKLNQSGIPTYTYVVPNGLAASAGSYIAMATDSILMGSGSAIGPSTPIVVGGTALEQNHTQAAMLSLMISLAEKWGRNTTAAYNMVQADQAFTAAQAYSYHVSNGFANSLSEALSQFGLSGKAQVFMSESLYDQFISALSNTLLDGVLILFGIIAIVLDIYHPTIILSIVGIVAIVLGLIGAEVVDASLLGFVVLAIAAALIILELKLGHGFAMMAGVALGAFGIYLLAQGVSYSPSPITVSTEIILILIALAGVAIGLYVRWIVAPIRRRKKFTGVEALLQKTGLAITDLTPMGEVRVEGVIWRAESASGNIAKGERVSVKALRGLVLIVEKAPEAKENGKAE